MTRRWPTDVADTFHHVWHRGAAQLPIFLDDADCRWFVEELGETAAQFGWSILTYVLMSNHFHLLLETHEPTLSAGMQRFGLRHARRNHRRHESAGHLFDAPYGHKLVTTDAHLMHLFKYIAANPVSAGLCDHPARHEWTAHRALLGAEHAIVDAERVADLIEGIANVSYADLFDDRPAYGEHWRDARSARPSVAGLVRQYGQNRGLRTARACGYTAQELADATGLSRATVTRRSR